MGFMSEIAVEYCIKGIVQELELELQENKNLETNKAIKRIGRFVLTQFEWGTPEWADKYYKLFKNN